MKIIAILILLTASLVTPTTSRLSQAAWSWFNHHYFYAAPADVLEPTPLKPPAYIALPVKLSNSTDPVLGAKAYFALDVDSGQTLLAHNEHQKLAIASTTKIITALVILQRHSLGEIVTVPQGLHFAPEDQIAGLEAGQRFRLDQMLKLMLIPSDDDAADALAIWDSGSLATFAGRMNAEAALWDLNDSHFANPDGLDQAGHLTSAHDLAWFARIALLNPTFANLVSTTHTTATDLDGRLYNLNNTNQLLADPRIKGIKTGFTLDAGQTLVVMAKYNGHEIITVVLGSPDRFGESETLVNHIFSNYQWQ